MSSFLKILCALLILGFGEAFSQGPLVAGMQYEIGSAPENGQNRLTPFVSLYFPSLGIFKVNYSTQSTIITDTLGASFTNEFRAWGVQLGGTLGGDAKPYLFGSYNSIGSYSEAGDLEWSEWGLGIGANSALTPWVSILLEGEFRWVGEHQILKDESTIEQTRWQLNLGFMFYLY